MDPDLDPDLEAVAFELLTYVAIACAATPDLEVKLLAEGPCVTAFLRWLPVQNAVSATLDYLHAMELELPREVLADSNVRRALRALVRSKLPNDEDDLLAPVGH